jgi:ribosomal protein S18 acetylase RimI-like enzyme
MNLDVALATERRLLEPICVFVEKEEFLVYRSERFPRYYGANGLELRVAKGALQDWEDKFRREFDPRRYRHVTLRFHEDPEFAPLVREATSSGYHVSHDAYLVATRLLNEGQPPHNLRLVIIDEEAAWSQLRHFEDRLGREQDWYDGEASSDRLFAKTRYVSEAVGIRWIALVDNVGEIHSKLGLFAHGDVCRLQDVATAPEDRRRGLATYLLRVALRHAFVEWHATGLVVCAARDYHAIDLYRKLGFAELGGVVTLMRYPVKDR